MEYCGEKLVYFLGEARSWRPSLYHQQLSLHGLGFCDAAGLNVISWRGAVESECLALQMGTVPAALFPTVTIQKTEFLN